MSAPGRTPSHRPADFDKIGARYSHLRRADLRLTTAIGAALDHWSSILNIGARARSYEPDDVTVVAVEPSMVMLGQHPGRLRAQAVAEAFAAPSPFSIPGSAPPARFRGSARLLTGEPPLRNRRGMEERRRTAILPPAGPKDN